MFSFLVFYNFYMPSEKKQELICFILLIKLFRYSFNNIKQQDSEVCQNSFATSLNYNMLGMDHRPLVLRSYLSFPSATCL